jgi:hypothetical protein
MVLSITQERFRLREKVAFCNENVMFCLALKGCIFQRFFSQLIRVIHMDNFFCFIDRNGYLFREKRHFLLAAQPQSRYH